MPCEGGTYAATTGLKDCSTVSGHSSLKLAMLCIYIDWDAKAICGGVSMAGSSQAAHRSKGSMHAYRLYCHQALGKPDLDAALHNAFGFFAVV
jgi:hypothetical protein